MVTLAELVRQRSRSIPDKRQVTFLTVDENGGFAENARSYGELAENGAALARALEGLGLRASQRFAIVMENQPEFAEAMVASSMLGAVFVPIEPRTKGDALGHILAFSECVGAVCSKGLLPRLAASLVNCPALEWIIVVGHGEPADDVRAGVVMLSYSEAIAVPAEPPALRIDAEAPMLIMFTSGSTGSPKGVVLTYAEMLRGVEHLPATLFHSDDRFYTGLSMAHIHGLITLLNSIVLGLPVVISRRFTKTRLWEICRRYRCTVFNALGGMFTEIYGVPAKADDADNPVRIVHSSGMPANLWEPFCERFGVGLLEGYGATEGGLLVNALGEGPIGSIGRPPSYLEAAILDGDGNMVGPGEEGEICFRRKDGAPMKVEYLKDPEASAEKTRGGWLHMGDLGHQDRDGWFYFHHRAGGAIRKNGEFVNPAIVQTAIATHSMIADVFVYGIQTETDASGERTVVAAVVPVDPERFSTEMLLAHCREVLQKKDVPEIWQVLDEIPKSVSQKPIERECIALLRESAVLLR